MNMPCRICMSSLVGGNQLEICIVFNQFIQLTQSQGFSSCFQLRDLKNFQHVNILCLPVFLTNFTCKFLNILQKASVSYEIRVPYFTSIFKVRSNKCQIQDSDGRWISIIIKLSECMGTTYFGRIQLHQYDQTSAYHRRRKHFECEGARRQYGTRAKRARKILSHTH